MVHILDVAERGVRISASVSRLTVTGRSGNIQKFPIKELDAVLLSESAMTLTGVALAALAKRKVPVVFCDGNYLPTGVLCPVIRAGAACHTMLEYQVSSKVPWKKQIWRKIISAKIRGQNGNLKTRGIRSELSAMAKKVRSGDPENLEAVAAARYWKSLALFPVRDRRKRDGNMVFNYVYAILYAAMARSICAAGLHPGIGIHHHGKYNPFNLASDLMEVFRPFADRIAFSWLDENVAADSLDRTTRCELIGRMYRMEISSNGERMMFFDAISHYVCSYKRSLMEQKSALLILPEEI